MDVIKPPPTHVVTALHYGLNAFLHFRRTVKSNENQRDIEGYLRVAIKAIPVIGIDTSANISLTEEQKVASEDLKIEYFGDAIIKAPSTFETAIRAWNELNGMSKNPTKVIAYTISPIKHYCKTAEVILNR